MAFVGQSGDDGEGLKSHVVFTHPFELQHMSLFGAGLASSRPPFSISSVRCT
jgi:hypothetical protein